jgi:hypothetical protein
MILQIYQKKLLFLIFFIYLTYSPIDIKKQLISLLAGKRCVQVIAHYNPYRVVGSPRAGGCTPLTPALIPKQ